MAKKRTHKRDILGVPGVTEKTLRALSKQERYMLRKRTAHICPGCGKEPLLSDTLGAKCLEKQRRRMAKRQGCKRVYVTKFSRACRRKAPRRSQQKAKA